MPRKYKHPRPGRNVLQPQSHSLSDERGLERLLFFSDAVFAIAITLLALEIRLPDPLPAGSLAHALLSIWPRYLAYGVSFVVIGLYWMGHHRSFRNVERYDERLLLLNLFLLMAVAFIPFASAVLSEYTTQTGTIFYAAAMMVGGLLSLLVWWYVQRHGSLVDEPLPLPVARRSLLRIALAPAVFALSIPLALWNPGVARLSWLVLLTGSLVRQGVPNRTHFL